MLLVIMDRMGPMTLEVHRERNAFYRLLHIYDIYIFIGNSLSSKDGIHSADRIK